jgi:hypothetical protein
VSYRERQRLADIQAAIDAIRSHLQRGDLSDGLREKCWRSSPLVFSLPPRCHGLWDRLSRRARRSPR